MDGGVLHTAMSSIAAVIVLNNPAHDLPRVSVEAAMRDLSYLGHFPVLLVPSTNPQCESGIEIMREDGKYGLLTERDREVLYRQAMARVI